MWFAANAVADALPAVTAGGYATLTSAVQLGFIAGTLLFSLFRIADRFSSSSVFFLSSVIAAATNGALLWASHHFAVLLGLRFVTGFFLAGIYPVGMKIAADVFPEGLGKALGFLVGALVLGTAFPHLIRSTGGLAGWKTVVLSASLLAVVGGCIVFFFLPKNTRPTTGRRAGFFTAFRPFRSKPFRSAAFGYFGHMWELYALWAILPVLFKAYNGEQAEGLSVSFWSFVVIAIGSIGCVGGGLLSQKHGSRAVAFYSLLLSGTCCLAAPVAFRFHPIFFLPLLLVWGLTVTADSPQFSALVARFAGAKDKGTALTLVTCIGFSITVVSIQLLKGLFAHYGAYSLWVLSAGPAFGLMVMRRPGANGQ